MRRTGDSKMNKKMIAIIALLLCAVLLLSSCGSQETPAVDGKKEEAGSGRERVVIYTAAEDERIAYLQEELNKKFPDTEIVIQSLGTGQLLSRLQAEGKNSDCDIFYDLEVVNAEIILNAAPDLFADLSGYDFSVYDASVTGYTDRHHKYAVNGKTAGAFLVNTKLLEENYAKLELLATTLLEKETMDGRDVEKLLGLGKSEELTAKNEELETNSPEEAKCQE